MYSTGKLYGLKENSIVDDRFDVLKSTDAACRHLKDLYDIYGNWFLALAAYNSGPGNANKGLRRSGGTKSYWVIWPYLPRETRGYVPAFIAMTYLLKHYEDHNIQPVYPEFTWDDVDTLMVRDLLSFEQITEYLSIEESSLKFLNPAYKAGIIPADSVKKFPLHLPKEYVGPFIENEDSIYAFKSKSGMEKEKIQAEIKKVKERKP